MKTESTSLKTSSMITKSKVTPIQRGNMSTLRADATKALQDVMSKHGLRVDLGRITFEPGREFRCKLTVVQPALDTKPGTTPKVGDSWKFGRGTYTIESVTGNEVIGSRMVTYRGMRRTRSYRIKLSSIILSGIKVC